MINQIPFVGGVYYPPLSNLQPTEPQTTNPQLQDPGTTKTRSKSFTEALKGKRYLERCDGINKGMLIA